jgi:hypothetical protein
MGETQAATIAMVTTIVTIASAATMSPAARSPKT